MVNVMYFLLASTAIIAGGYLWYSLNKGLNTPLKFEDAPTKHSKKNSI